MKYQEIKNIQAPLIECFFAFSNSQFEQGVKENNLENKKILSAGNGLYGTKEGITNFIGFYDNLSKKIGEQCNPQDVYNYEYANHECGYTNDDTEVIKICLGYFTETQCKEIKRKNAYYSINDILKNN